MTRFILRRLGVFVATVFVASIAVFGSLYLAPGNPIDFLLGNRPSTPEQRAALTEQYHLNQGFMQRYFSWIHGLLTGRLGDSIQQHVPVTDLLRSATSTTVLLVLMTFLLTLIVGVAMGSLSVFRSRRLDDAVSALMNLCIATPAFVAAMVLISLFAVNLGWFPVFGRGSGLSSQVHHLMLPAVALAIGWWPIVGSVMQSVMREEIDREHVEMALSRGLPPFHVFRKHVLRNALVPIVTASGLSLAGLVVGTVIVGSVFQLNGLGDLLITSVLEKDFAVAQTISMILFLVFAVTNFAVDIFAAVIDPRVRSKWSQA